MDKGITRDGVTYLLTPDELEAVYREAQTAYMREDIEKIITKACEDTNAVIPEKVKTRIIDKAAELYEEYESSSEDVLSNCREAVYAALSDFAVKIGKRKTKLLQNSFY